VHSSEPSPCLITSEKQTINTSCALPRSRPHAGLLNIRFHAMLPVSPLSSASGGLSMTVNSLIRWKATSAGPSRGIPGQLSENQSN